jgi:hypothetical protein
MQFLALSIIAAIFGALIIKRRSHFVFSGKVIWSLWIAFAALIASAIMSPDFIGSMTGDTGRFTGVISAFCLLIVAIFHAGFTLEQFKRLVWLYIGVVVVTQIIGVLHDQMIFDLPGDWYIDYFEPNEDFYVDYRCGTYKVQIFSHGVDYNFQIQNGDFLLENINYREIKDANAHALRFMQSHPVADTNVSALEIEALALEYELQLKRL